MKKKLLSLLLCGALALTAACSSADSDADADEEEVTEDAAEGEDADSEEAEGEEEASVPEATEVRDTAYGQVAGYSEDGTLIWMGVPYAAAPRWKAPEDPEAWDDVLETVTAGNVGLQVSDEEVIGSEDCLNLDIYRPDSDEEDLPVLVYIHGGNNQTGESTEISGKTLATEANCIVVSVNYRLGILGFNSLPAVKGGTEEENSGNYTLLDIAKSLDWIAENIENFGGDKDNITVSGFSAGGRDVMAMLISPTFEGKFHKAISFSGGMTVAEEEPSINNTAKALAPLVVEDGVKADEDEAYEWLKSDDEEVADYLYEMDGDRLVSVMTNAGIRMSVFPHLFTDGTVIPEEGFDTDSYNSVPLIMLTGSGEFSLFALGSPYFYTEEYLAKSEEEQAAEAAFANKYGGMLYKLCNAQESAEIMSDSYDAPIYLCEFTMGEDADDWVNWPPLVLFTVSLSR